jgi:hypothetical protein
MQSRVARVTIVALLLAAGVGAGLQLTSLLTQSRQLADRHLALLTQLTRFDQLLAEVSTAQAAYVAPGQPDAPWFERVADLSARLHAELDQIRSRTAASDSPAAIAAVTEAFASLAMADTAARENLALEQDLIAADIVFGEALTAVNNAHAAVARLERAEAAAFESSRAAGQQQMLLVAAAVAGIWLVGVLVLLPRPAASKAADAPGLADITRVSTPVLPEPAAPTGMVDLPAAAELCTAISRVVASSALPDMLARTAALLDASGVIVWLGDRDELHAAMSHGYNPRVIRQLGSIARAADNATAEAWRTGELRTVAGDMMSNGAIVAPMFGPEACVGVLAAEVRHGRELDPGTQAVTAMIAAQLSTVLGAWPADAQAARAVEA